MIARAWRCQQRLYRRWCRMAARGKPNQKIVVACARELAGFVWAIGSEQPPTRGALSDESLRLEQRSAPDPQGGPSKHLCGAGARRRPATLERASSQPFPVMRSRPGNVSLIHRRSPGPSAAPSRKVNPQALTHRLTSCSMSDG